MRARGRQRAAGRCRRVRRRCSRRMLYCAWVRAWRGRCCCCALRAARACMYAEEMKEEEGRGGSIGGDESSERCMPARRKWTNMGKHGTPGLPPGRDAARACVVWRGALLRAAARCGAACCCT